MNFQISGFLSQRKASKVFENKKMCWAKSSGCFATQASRYNEVQTPRGRDGKCLEGNERVFGEDGYVTKEQAESKSGLS